MKTDSQLQQDVIDELKWKPYINATDIGVEVKDGVVTLTGHVDSYAEKWQAENVTQKVPGVRALAVEIDVRLPGSSVRNDADIARTIENVLEGMTLVLPKNTVKVMVEKGWVTLGGEVNWDYQRQAATNAIRYLMGVRGVSNQITLKHQLSSTTIKSDIEAALKRVAEKDARNISVTVKGEDVTLTGQLHSWHERTAVSQSVWCIPGVRHVINNISLSPA